MAIGPGTALMWGVGLNTATDIGAMLMGEEKVGLSREDQRWLADFNWKQSLRQEKLQNDLAKHGIAMRVKDAQAAGIHPLAALGIPMAQTSGGQQVFGGDSEPGGPGKVARGLGQMGQNISRAAMAAASQDSREMVELNKQQALANIEFTRKQAALAEWQANALRNPPMPSLYQQYRDPSTGDVVTLYHPDVARSLGPFSAGMFDLKRSFAGPDQQRFNRRMDEYYDEPGQRRLIP